MQVSKTRSLLAVLVLGLLTLAASSSGAQTTGRRRSSGGGVIVVSGTRGVSDTYCVNGRRVSVNGRGHRIVLHGRCPSLRVGGTGNRVYADAVGVISLSGSNNRVQGG